jgi:hypothetical protein
MRHELVQVQLQLLQRSIMKQDGRRLLRRRRRGSSPSYVRGLTDWFDIDQWSPCPCTFVRARGCRRPWAWSRRGARRWPTSRAGLMSDDDMLTGAAAASVPRMIVFPHPCCIHTYALWLLGVPWDRAASYQM